MATRDLVLYRHHYWLRAKQLMFGTLCLAGAAAVAMSPIEARFRLWGTVAIALFGLVTLLVWEGRSMRRSTPFTVMPPGWGTMRHRAAEGAGRLMSLYEFWPYRWRPGALLIGRPLPEQQILGLFRSAWFGPQDNRHMLTIASSQTGKATAALIPNLLLYPGSALVIDPKGELAQITARRRGHAGSRDATSSDSLGQDVFVFDPEAIVVGLGNHGWNPLADMVGDLDPANPELWGRASQVALSIVPIAHGEAQTEYFLTHARNILTALILYVVAEEPPERQNLIFVRRLILQGDTGLFDLIEHECRKLGVSNPCIDAHEALFRMLAQSKLHGGKIAGIFSRLATKGTDELSGILGTLDEQTSFLDDHLMEKALVRNDFSLRALKQRPTTIYVCLRGSKLASPMAKIVRVMIDLAIDVLEKITQRPEHPVLFMMDEFYALGRSETLDRSIGLVASYGITLWPVLQSISQLKRHYPDTWDSFILNSRGVQIFGEQKTETLQWVSERIGERVLHRADGTIERRPLLSVNELSGGFLHRTSRRQIFLPSNGTAAALGLIDYYDGSFPKHWYDKDPRI